MAPNAALLTTSEVAAILRYSPSTVRRMVDAGEIRGAVMGRRRGIRIPSSEVRRLLASIADDDTGPGIRVWAAHYRSSDTSSGLCPFSCSPAADELTCPEGHDVPQVTPVHPANSP